jgi:hypothetical protein
MTTPHTPHAAPYTHSPGPWATRRVPGALFEIRDSDGNAVLRIRGGMDPMAPDARLIAAAPELLDLARRVRVWARHSAANGLVDWHEVAEMVDAAIARATGDAA